MRRLTTSSVLLLGAAACHLGARPQAASSSCDASGPPAIATVRPDTAPASANVQLEVTGCRFDPAANDVLIGAFTMHSVAADASGTRLRFALPQFRPLGTDAPPAPLPPGTYTVVVRNRYGTSVPAHLTLTFRP